MTSWISQSFLFVSANVTIAMPAYAQKLGGGENPDISFWRILLTLLACLLIAIVVIWFFHNRNMAGTSSATTSFGNKPAWFSKLSFLNSEIVDREIEIREMRKINAQTDICLLSCREREYLILLSGNDVTVLQDQNDPNQIEEQE